MAQQQRFSLFLTPCETDFARLAALIREVSAACKAAPFEPHVTVHSGDFTDPECVNRAVSAAVSGIRPFSLRVAGIGCGMEYFRSVYVEFEESGTLRGIHDRLKGRLGGDAGYRFMPHLSLVYTDIPFGEKEDLARSVVLAGDEILFDRVKVVVPQNPRLLWRDVGGWRTLLTWRLGEAERCGQ